MSDIYQKWNEQGILRKKLLSISFLINAGIPIKDICKKENISLKQFYELRKKYSDLADVSEKGNLEGLYFCIDNLIDMAEGYTNGQIRNHLKDYRQRRNHHWSLGHPIW